MAGAFDADDQRRWLAGRNSVADHPFGGPHLLQLHIARIARQSSADGIDGSHLSRSARLTVPIALHDRIRRDVGQRHALQLQGNPKHAQAFVQRPGQVLLDLRAAHVDRAIVGVGADHLADDRPGFLVNEAVVDSLDRDPGNTGVPLTGRGRDLGEDAVAQLGIRGNAQAHIDVHGDRHGAGAVRRVGDDDPVILAALAGHEGFLHLHSRGLHEDRLVGAAVHVFPAEIQLAGFDDLVLPPGGRQDFGHVSGRHVDVLGRVDASAGREHEARDHEARGDGLFQVRISSVLGVVGKPLFERLLGLVSGGPIDGRARDHFHARGLDEHDDDGCDDQCPEDETNPLDQLPCIFVGRVLQGVPRHEPDDERSDERRDKSRQILLQQVIHYKEPLFF